MHEYYAANKDKFKKGLRNIAQACVNAFMFGGLLATLPDAKRFEAFEKAHS